MFRMLLKYVAGLLGVFALVNVGLGLMSPAWDGNIWWVDTRWAPGWLSTVTLAGCGLAIIAGAVSHLVTARRAAAGAAALLCALTCADALRYALLVWQGTVHSGLMVPLSLLVTLVFAGSVWAFGRAQLAETPSRRALAMAVAIFLAAAFPVLQMCWFGATDYRRPAAAILVLGARTYADGRPSDALADRVRAGAELYRQGFAPLVIMSGGPGDGAIHETQAMKALAESLGVPDDRIVCDDRGVNTRASIRNCRRFVSGPVLAVSHSYHLPRIKLEADRAGVTVYTVPAPQGQPLRKLPLFVARETLAWWWYYARPA